jgi:hypothetical protein
MYFQSKVGWGVLWPSYGYSRDRRGGRNCWGSLRPTLFSSRFRRLTGNVSGGFTSKYRSTNIITVLPTHHRLRDLALPFLGPYEKERSEGGTQEVERP